MTIIFADSKQINPVDESTSDAYYYAEIVKLTGQSGPGYRFIARTIEQVPQQGGVEPVINEYLIPVKIDNNSPNFYKNTLNLPPYVLAQGIDVTNDIAIRFAYKWLESK